MANRRWILLGFGKVWALDPVNSRKICVSGIDFQFGKVFGVILERLGSNFASGSDLGIILGGLGVKSDLPGSIRESFWGVWTASEAYGGRSWTSEGSFWRSFWNPKSKEFRSLVSESILEASNTSIFGK